LLGSDEQLPSKVASVFPVPVSPKSVGISAYTIRENHPATSIKLLHLCSRNQKGNKTRLTTSKMSNNLKLTIMKRFIMTIAAALMITASARAMSYSEARSEALYLTNKMAYELGLDDEIGSITMDKFAKQPADCEIEIREQSKTA
jgi:hypothetical protein